MTRDGSNSSALVAATGRSSDHLFPSNTRRNTSLVPPRLLVSARYTRPPVPHAIAGKRSRRLDARCSPDRRIVAGAYGTPSRTTLPTFRTFRSDWSRSGASLGISLSSMLVALKTMRC